MQKCTLALGCFWKPEENFKDKPGILETEVGWCEPVIYTFNTEGEIIDFELIPRNSEPSKSNFPKFELSNN